MFFGKSRNGLAAIARELSVGTLPEARSVEPRHALPEWQL